MCVYALKEEEEETRRAFKERFFFWSCELWIKRSERIFSFSFVFVFVFLIGLV